MINEELLLTKIEKFCTKNELKIKLFLVFIFTFIFGIVLTRSFIAPSLTAAWFSMGFLIQSWLKKD